MKSVIRLNKMAGDAPSTAYLSPTTSSLSFS